LVGNKGLLGTSTAIDTTSLRKGATSAPFIAQKKENKRAE
jgi:hypothetical protein